MKKSSGNKAMDKLIQQINANGFKDLIRVQAPYSRSYESGFFNAMNGMWVDGLFDKSTLIQITKEDFEESLVNDEVRKEYVKRMCEGSRYWLSAIDDDKLISVSLYMDNGRELTMFFVEYIIKSI